MLLIAHALLTAYLQTSPVAHAPVTRIAVTDFDLVGVDAHRGRIVQLALVAELRKLQGVSVISSDEVRALLEHEANKQLVGCSEESCLGEIADALGVDVLIVGTLARTDVDSAFTMRRVSQKEGKVVGAFDRRFEVGNGEEYLVAIGPAIDQLFREIPLRAGLERGVAKEMALRLNPPPLPSWVFWSGTATSAALLGGTVVVGVMNVQAANDAVAYKSGNDVIKAVGDEKTLQANNLAYTTSALAGATVAFGIATGVSAFFTDFAGYAAMNEEALQ